MQLLTAYHPDWKDIPLLYDTRQVSMTLEGGDVLALCPTGIAVGCSQRTSVHAVDHLARQLFRQSRAIPKCWPSISRRNGLSCIWIRS